MSNVPCRVLAEGFGVTMFGSIQCKPNILPPQLKTMKHFALEQLWDSGRGVYIFTLRAVAIATFVQPYRGLILKLRVDHN